jgi:hypothetical protein
LLRWRLGFGSSYDGVRRFSPPHRFAGGWVLARQTMGIGGFHRRIASLAAGFSPWSPDII